jgi:trimeric autotransporter adhesin
MADIKKIEQNVPGLVFIKKLTPITYTLDINGIEAKLHDNIKSPGDKNLAPSTSYLNDPVMQQSMTDKSSITYTGFVAQDVEKAANSLGFSFSGIDKPKDVNQSFYGLRYGDFVVPLVKAVQELSESSDRKDSTINIMQGQLDSLQTQINQLRTLLLTRNGSAPSGASLDQNVPNPSSHSTTIGYSLPQGVSSAKMQITDMRGNVMQIVSLSGVGRNSVTIDTSRFTSGTYIYSLLIDDQLVGTKKMVAIR